MHLRSKSKTGMLPELMNIFHFVVRLYNLGSNFTIGRIRDYNESLESFSFLAPKLWCLLANSAVSLNKFKTKINSCTAYHYHCWLCKNMLGEKDSITLFHRFLCVHAFVIFFLDHLHYFYFFSKSIKILETSESIFLAFISDIL